VSNQKTTLVEHNNYRPISASILLKKRKNINTIERLANTLKNYVKFPLQAEPFLSFSLTTKQLAISTV
jgi:hypothetical protein